MSPVDQIAREVANKALQRIEGHEDLCAERWRQNQMALERLTRSIEQLGGRWFSVMTWGLATMAAVIMGLLVWIFEARILPPSL
jgi:hypothetical protein